MDSYSMEEVTFSFFQQFPNYIHLRILLPRFFPEDRREVRVLCKTYLNIISISNSTFQPQKFTNFHGWAGDVSGLYQVLICLRNACTIESVFPLCDLALFREPVHLKCQKHSRVQLSFYLCTTQKLKYFKPSLNLNLRRQEEISLVPRISQEQYFPIYLELLETISSSRSKTSHQIKQENSSVSTANQWRQDKQ